MTYLLFVSHTAVQWRWWRSSALAAVTNMMKYSIIHIKLLYVIVIIIIIIVIVMCVSSSSSCVFSLCFVRLTHTHTSNIMKWCVFHQIHTHSILWDKIMSSASVSSLSSILVKHDTIMAFFESSLFLFCFPFKYVNYHVCRKEVKHVPRKAFYLQKNNKFGNWK